VHPSRNLSRAWTSRWLVLAAVLALVATACSGGDDDGGGSDAGGSEAEEAGADEAVEIRFSWWGSDERAEITQEAIDLFEEANPNITVTADFVDFDGYFDRLATSVAAGDAPDVITLGGSYPAEYAGRGALYDLGEASDVLRTDGIEEAVLEGGVIDGTLYGIPTGVNAYAMLADPQIFEEAGVELPDDATWTWEDFAETAAEVSAATPDDVFGAQDPTYTGTLEAYARQQGEPGLYTSDGDLALTEETLVDWFDLMLQMRDSGGTPAADRTAELLTDGAPERQLIATNNAAMMAGWSNLLAQYNEASGRELQLMKLPGEGEGTPGMWLHPSQFYSVAADSEHPTEAAMLIDFLINEPAAGEVILADRGFPVNTEVRGSIESLLEAPEAAQADFLDRLETEIGPPPNDEPVGASETLNILNRLYPEVLFDRMTPEDAATEFVTQVRAEIQP
jgi:multiple sugar transport system substrate-binding protein